MCVCLSAFVRLCYYCLSVLFYYLFEFICIISQKGFTNNVEPSCQVDEKCTKFIYNYSLNFQTIPDLHTFFGFQAAALLQAVSLWQFTAVVQTEISHSGFAQTFMIPRVWCSSDSRSEFPFIQYFHSTNRPCRDTSVDSQFCLYFEFVLSFLALAVVCTACHTPPIYHVKRGLNKSQGERLTQRADICG